MSGWHADRALGQAERFERVARCGAETGLEWFDAESGEVKPHTYACGCWRVCSRCASRRRERLRSGVVAQRALARALYRDRMNRRYAGREGRWRERLITVTVPHSGDLARDVRTLVDAWRDVEAPWRRHLISRGLRGGQAYVRAIEVANAEHAHMHIWVLGPYLEHSLLRAWWGAALERRGYEVPRHLASEVEEEARDGRTGMWLRRYVGLDGCVPYPVVDIRSKGIDGEAAAYATKVGAAMYTVKSGEYVAVSPEHAARIFEALEGTRAVQWARGWAPIRERSARWHLRRVAQVVPQVIGGKGKCGDSPHASGAGCGVSIAHACPFPPRSDMLIAPNSS